MQAVGERAGANGNNKLTTASVNALVEAVMASLRQAKESIGGLPTSLSGGNTLAGGDDEVLMSRGIPNSLPQGYATGTIRHAKTLAPADPAQKIQPKLEGGNYEQIIQRASERYGVDADLIRSVIKVESNFNPKAVSHAGAQGMMQLMPGTAAELGVKDAFNAEENIMGGTLYLSRLLDRYDGNVRSALAAYNWGMGNLERQPASAMPGETRRYVARIIGMVEGDTPAV
ncbi:MAG: lytic transglycosylase domain-containing protein [Magnetococcales bacterium]|nr:lytic transglycosylase domain-containing protein [Magnetococcales bacterium]